MAVYNKYQVDTQGQSDRAGSSEKFEPESTGAVAGAAQLLEAYENATFEQAMREDMWTAFRSATSAMRLYWSNDPRSSIRATCFTNNVSLGGGVGGTQKYLLQVKFSGPRENGFYSWISPIARQAGGGTITNSTSDTFSIFIPPPASGVPSKSEPSWVTNWRSISSKVSLGITDGALYSLNGCNMYDMLRILQKMVQSGGFNALFNAVGSTSGIGTTRILAAMSAALATLSSGSPWSTFVSSFGMQNFAMLADFEQRDISNFLGGTKSEDATDAVKIVGKWRVKVDRWTWRYTFDAKHNVSWLDQGNGRSGYGRWKEDGNRIKTSWAPSKTIEYWNLPISPSGQTGKAIMAEGTFDLKAEKL